MQKVNEAIALNFSSHNIKTGHNSNDSEVKLDSQTPSKLSRSRKVTSLRKGVKNMVLVNVHKNFEPTDANSIRVEKTVHVTNKSKEIKIVLNIILCS